MSDSVVGIVGVILAIAGFFNAYYHMGIGVDMYDEAYQIMNSADPLNTPLAVLTALFMKFFNGLFNPTMSLLPLRHLFYWCWVAVVLFAGWFYWYKTKRLSTGLLIVGLGIWISGFIDIGVWMVNWDAPSGWLAVIVAVLGCLYKDRPTLLLSIFIGLMCGVAGLFRLPNLYLLGVGCCWILWCERHNPGVAVIRSVAALIAGLALFLVVIIVLYGSLTEYVRVIHENMIGAHGVKALIKGYYLSLSGYLRWGFLLVLLYLFITKTISSRGSSRIVWGVIAGLMAVGTLLVLLRNVESFLVLYDPSGIFFVLIGLVALWCCKRGTKGVVLFIILCSLTVCVGSNTGFMKIITYPLIPLLWAYIPNNKVERSLMTLFVTCGVIYTVLYVIHWKRRAFFHPGSDESTYVMESGVFEGIRTTPKFGSWYNETFAAIDSLADLGLTNRVVLSLGSSRFGWEYCIGSRGESLRHNWDIINKKDTDPQVVHYFTACRDSISSTQTLIIFPNSLNKTHTDFSGSVYLDSLLQTRLEEIPTLVADTRFYRLRPEASVAKH